MIIVRSTRHWV